MEFIRENWIILIFIGVFLHLIIRRGYLMTRKGGAMEDTDMTMRGTIIKII